MIRILQDNQKNGAFLPETSRHEHGKTDASTRLSPCVLMDQWM